MVERIIKLFEDDLLDRKWVDRYSGIVRPMERKFPVGEDKFITEIIPTACSAVNVECNEKELYYMTPKKDVMSVVYWEMLSDPTIEPYNAIPNNKGVKIKARLRLVVWYDKRLLGHVGCESLSEIDQDVIGLYRMIKRNTEDPLAYSVSMTLANLRYDFNTIFSKYTYGSSKWKYLFENPYGYKAYDFELEVLTSWDCLPIFETGPPESCLPTVIDGGGDEGAGFTIGFTTGFNSKQ